MQILGEKKKAFKGLTLQIIQKRMKLLIFFFAKFAYKYDITLVIGQQKN